jgi:Aldehyde dehydrogenase family
MLAQRRRLPRDWFFAPTLLTDVRNSMSVAREEAFGPVFTMITYDDMDDAVAIRCRDPDRAMQRPDTPDERDSRTLDRRMPTRAPGPNPHLEPGPPAPDPAPVRNPP